MPITAEDSIYPKAYHDTAGISLRTWLAAQAMQGFLSWSNSTGSLPISCAEEAVRYADALILAINKPQS